MGSLNRYKHTFSALSRYPYSYRKPPVPRSVPFQGSFPHLSDTISHDMVQTNEVDPESVLLTDDLRSNLNPLTIPVNPTLFSELDNIDSAYDSSTPSSASIEFHGNESPYTQEHLGSPFSNASVTSDWDTHNTPFVRSEAGPYLFLKSARGISTPTSATSDSLPKPKKFYCPYCIELGKIIEINTKHDWKRHIKNFHEDGSVAWQCICNKIFESERDLKDHFKHQHGNTRPRSTRESKIFRKSLPRKVYACGCTDCIKVYDCFKKWCNHVADEIRDHPPSKWSYTWRIKNILRHEDIAATWDEVHTYWCSKLGTVGELEWNPQTTHCILKQLECLSFKSYEQPQRELRRILEQLFKKGLSSYHISPGYGIIPSQPTTLNPPVVDPQLDFPSTGDVSYNQAVFPNFTPAQFPEVTNAAHDFTSTMAHASFDHSLDDNPVAEPFFYPQAEEVPFELVDDTPTWQEYMEEPPIPSVTNPTPPLPPLQSPVPQRHHHKLSLSRIFTIQDTMF